MRDTIDVEGLPKMGPYSLAIKTENLVFLSGQTGEGNDFQTQFKNAMKKVEIILNKAGSSLNNVLEVTVYLAKSDYFKEMNEIYKEYFNSSFPARTTLVTSFPNEKVMVEIDVIANVH